MTCTNIDTLDQLVSHMKTPMVAVTKDEDFDLISLLCYIEIVSIKKSRKVTPHRPLRLLLLQLPISPNQDKTSQLKLHTAKRKSNLH